MYDFALHVVVMKLFECIERIPAMLINHINVYFKTIHIMQSFYKTIVLLNAHNLGIFIKNLVIEGRSVLLFLYYFDEFSALFRCYEYVSNSNKKKSYFENCYTQTFIKY